MCCSVGVDVVEMFIYADVPMRYGCASNSSLAIAELNRVKAEKLYAAIDGSGLYSNSVAASARSRMNVTFRLRDPSLDAAFLEQAEAAGLKNLKGHRIVGGMRASLYNSMPLAGVEALCEFLREFERKHPRG